MQRAQAAAQRVLAAQRRTNTACNRLTTRSYSPSPLHGRRKREGGSSQLPRFRQRSQPLRSQQRQPSVFATSVPRDQLSPKALTAAIVQHLGNLQEHIEDPEYQNFIRDLTSALGDSLSQSQKAAPIVDSLRHSFIEQGLPGLKTQLKYAFHGYLASRRFSKINLQDQARVADIRYPVEWYPKTRQMQRMIHLHVGPTNSGKTYHALKRLEQVQVGLYAGPLRLLAHEVYTRLKASGKPCNLITGDERQIAEADGVSMSSCTVEMVPVNADFDVAVVDEIQMIGHEERGWAWTQAVLGLKAKELHLCGEERTVPLIKELAAAMGDDLQIHHYQRLSPLKTMSASLKGNLGSLRKGDCVLAFSKVQIHKIKREIEIRTKKPVAVVYGSLPPEIRAQQAQLFNDPNNDYDILVASDAIGMGLNLSIKRIIFTTTRKFNGRSEVPVQIAQIKQIAGRAGRYRTAAQAAAPDIIAKDLTGLEAKSRTGSPVISPAKTLGLVTTLHQGDLSALRNAMENQADPIMSAGLLPPVNVLVRFAAYFPPSTPFSYILLSLHNKSILHPRFHLCSQQDHLLIADTIEPVKNLTISDRIIFCASPASLKDDTQRPVLRAFAECVGNKGGGGILDIRALNLELLNQQVIVGSKDYLQKLESLHKSLILYLWLSYRFAGIFSTQALAFYVKSLVEERIQQTLSQASATIRHVASGSRLGNVHGHLGTLNLQLAKADDDRNGADQFLGARHLPRDNVFRKEDISTVKGKTPTKSSIGLDVTIPDLISHPQPWGRDSPP